MKLKIIQSQYGKFNIIGDEYQVSLSIGIYDGDKLLNVDGEDIYIKIFKDVSSKEEGEYLVDMFNLAFNEFRIHEIFKHAFKDNHRDYKFCKIFIENIDEIYSNHNYEHKEDKGIVKQSIRNFILNELDSQILFYERKIENHNKELEEKKNTLQMYKKLKESFVIKTKDI